jgi:hypothetical protein
VTEPAVTVAPTTTAHRDLRPGHRRRRPTGAAPPLPRALGTTGKAWLVLIGVFLVGVPLAVVIPGVLRLVDQADTAVLRALAELRTPWLTSTMREIDRIGVGWTVTAVAAAMLVLLIVFRRWRHLLTWVGSLFLL